MENQELMRYMQDAITQETDIMQQERIIDEFDVLQYARRPILRQEDKPPMPEMSEYRPPILALLLMGIVAAYSVISSCVLLMDDGLEMIFVPLLLLFLCALVSMHFIGKSRACREANEHALNTHHQTCRNIDNRNKEARDAYERNLRSWNHLNTEMHSFMQKPLDESRALLDRYYASEIIYPKYRTLPALTSIYEYFMTGRCTELTGPHGAYNLYEDELRKDTVISQLNTVIENLEQIRHNQYMLYQQVKAIQENTATIASELQQIKGYTVQIAQLTALNAYYAALNERNTRITMYHHL